MHLPHVSHFISNVIVSIDFVTYREKEEGEEEEESIPNLIPPSLELVCCCFLLNMKGGNK